MTIPSEAPDGLLLADKPAGPTSHDVVARARRLLGTRRVGHAGTLDPFATGLLVLCVGRATRLAGLLAGSDKTYSGEMRFGFATDTGDATGAPLGEPLGGGAPALEALRELVTNRLSGTIAQVPPMYSAKKREGVALYKLARRGETVEREPVMVSVSGWSLRETSEPDIVAFDVTCSAGTYVRVLASELGELVGCPAHLRSLRRHASGSFDVADAASLDDLASEIARERVVPMRTIALPMPDHVLEQAAQRNAFAHGQAVGAHDAADGRVAVRDPSGELVGLATIRDGMLRPDAVLIDPI